jgi:ribosomal RNA methyltransferase Nop2
MYKKKNTSFKKTNSSLYFKEKYDSLFGEGTFQHLLEAQKKYHNTQYIRINQSKIDPNILKKIFTKKNIKFEETPLPNCLKIISSPFSLASTPEHLLGWFYLQNLPSQIPVLSLNWKKIKSELTAPLRILDMCASPGSKTSQLSDLLSHLTIPHSIVALEPDRKRFTRFLNNMQKQLCKHITFIESKAETFTSKEKFDIIFVDAPCSGNLVGDNYWLTKRNQKGIYENSTLQKKILENASKLLKENGSIVYSTCSLEVEENEENIHYAIKHLNLKPQDIQLKLGFDTTPLLKHKGGNFHKEVSKALRIMPHKSKTEGFFVCVMRKDIIP